MRTLLATTFLTIVLWTSPAVSQVLITEVIPLGNRSAADIIPVLKSLVSPPGTVTGLYTSLVVKTDADTLKAIKQILRELDRAPRNLLVTVEHGISDNLRNSALGASVLVNNEGSQGSVRIFDTCATTGGQDTQTVRVLEGHQAFIQFGESVPLDERAVIMFGDTTTIEDSIEYQDITTGFYALPQLSGDRVVVQISPYRRELSDLGGVIDVQQGTTTVAGRLGEWILLGGGTNEAQHDETSTVYSTRAYQTSTHSVYLRVELIN